MKKCSSCGSLLKEDYTLSVMRSWPVSINEKNYSGKKAGYLSAYICPECGKIELYLKK